MHNKKEVLKLKKFISLCLVLVLACSMSVTAFAESYGTNNNTMPYYWYAETTLSGQIYSSCTVSIPETVYAGSGYTGNITISNADIENGYEVVIRVANLTETDTITLSNANNDKTIGCSIKTVEKTLTRQDNVLGRMRDEIIMGTNNKSGSVEFQALITEHTGATAGTYTGTMQFEVMIEPYM